MAPLRTTRDRETARDWSLVLASRGIASRLLEVGGVWRLDVAEEDTPSARAQLEAYDRENAGRAAKPVPAPVYGPTRVGVLLAIALPLLFLVSGPYDRAAPWHARGAAASTAILAGEVWRVITALTLHTDVVHVLGNAAAAAGFTTLLFRALGPGLGGALIVVAGAGGNALNAWAQGPGHVSVGASTAIFGAVGVLCGLQFARRWRVRVRRRGAWLPLAAGLGLLAMLGTAGEHTDISAHVLGLACGIPLGAIGARLTGPPGTPAQSWWGAAALACVCSSWILAWSGGL